MRLLRSLLVGLVAAPGLAGCASFEPLPAELGSRLAERADAATPVRLRARAEVESEAFAGAFEAVVIADPACSCARVQLMPEVGGKVLDLVVGPDRIAGYLPPAGIALVHPPETGEPLPRHLLTFLAASVLELATPIAPERVRGARAVEGGTELRLRGALEGVEVLAVVDADGRVLERRYRVRGVRWRERVDGEQRTFDAPGVRWTMHEREPEPIDAPPAALFELEVPRELLGAAGAPRP